MENSRSEQLTSFKVLAILSSVTKSHAIWICPAWDRTPPFVCISTLCMPPALCHFSSHLGCQIHCHSTAVLVFRWPLFYFMITQRASWQFGLPVRRCKLFPLSEKVKVLNVMSKEKTYAEVAKIFPKTVASLSGGKRRREGGKRNWC